MYMIKYRISKRTIECYKNYTRLIDRLSLMSREERMSEYQKYEWMFPKRKKKDQLDLVNLDDQFNSRKDYGRKFKYWFIVVCEFMLSSAHLGECSYELFKKKYYLLTGEKSTGDRYAQKVILALGMMGYLTRIKENYSNAGYEHSHGYIFEMDMFVLNGWEKLFEEGEKDEGCSMDGLSLKGEERMLCVDRELRWDGLEDWRVWKQYETICSLEVKDEYKEKTRNVVQSIEDFCDRYGRERLPEKNKQQYKILRELLCLIENETSNLIDFKVDDYGGRLYSFMTKMRSDVRKGCLLLEGERVCEIDISSAQPTLMALVAKGDKGDYRSKWLDHCLKGDFYQWVAQEVVGDANIPKDEIKTWMMKFLYSSSKIVEMGKEYKTKYKMFEKAITRYMKENEHEIYALYEGGKTNLVEVKRRKPTKNGTTTKKRNDLSKCLVKKEVEYIKRCIGKLPQETKFYTIHDCICCKESDVEVVRKVMEEASMEMFGVVIKLKVE